MRIVGATLLILLITSPRITLALVDINTASFEELDELPWVGVSTAEQIVAGRPYSATSEIQSVSGIGGPGSTTYDDIIDLITVGSSESESEDINNTNNTASTSDSDDDNNSKQRERLPVNDLVVEVPEFAYVNQPVELAVTPAGGRRDRLVRYDWNFGDGNTGKGIDPTHTYSHSGKYVVVVESYYMKEYLVARQEITVSPVELSLTREPGGEWKIENIGAREMDLHRMRLSGGEGFTFPKHSFLLPGSSVTLPVQTATSLSIALLDAAGEVVARPNQRAREAKLPASPPRVAAATVSADTGQDTPPTEEVTESNTVADSTPQPIQPATNTVAATTSSREPFEYLPYLGLAGIVLLGMYGIWGGRRFT